MWAALAALSVVVIGAISVGLIWLGSHVLRFLQPILIPFAVSGVLAYLLGPVVDRLVSWGQSRQRAVLIVFAAVSVAFAGMVLLVAPAIYRQSIEMAVKLKASRPADVVARIVDGTRARYNGLREGIREKFNVELLPELSFPVIPRSPDAGVAGAEPNVGAPAGTAEAPGGVKDPDAQEAGAPAAAPKGPGVMEGGLDLQQFLSGDWIWSELPRKAWSFVSASVGGFLGVFGFLLSMVIVPVYLYYFLIESRNISESWGDYLPLRTSRFKDEVVETLEEINGYLIAFFRGQLLVSVINGVATGLGLLLIGLDFGLLIGVLLCFLGLIPYLGIMLCWVPAVLIALVHGSSWLIPASPWWLFPLAVTVIFVLVHQFDGLFVTPRIVGESVGLHPMTVIASVFVWSLLMGGLLGAILAVPMTATIKVVLKRYVWQRRFLVQNDAPPAEA